MTTTIPLFPTIDGHFWIVRDDKIVDFEFKEYDFIKKINKCKGEKIYLPAPEMTQKIAINIFEKVLNIIFKKDSIEKNREIFYLFSKKLGFNKPTFSRCFQNVIMEIYLNGGEIVFGSMGWKREDGSIHYEYGGEEYLTWNDFKA
jgi:hypothetical protein